MVSVAENVQSEAQRIYDLICEAIDKVTGSKRPDYDPIQGFMLIAIKSKGTQVNTIIGKMSAEQVTSALCTMCKEIMEEAEDKHG